MRFNKAAALKKTNLGDRDIGELVLEQTTPMRRQPSGHTKTQKTNKQKKKDAWSYAMVSADRIAVYVSSPICASAFSISVLAAAMAASASVTPCATALASRSLSCSAQAHAHHRKNRTKRAQACTSTTAQPHKPYASVRAARQVSQTSWHRQLHTARPHSHARLLHTCPADCGDITCQPQAIVSPATPRPRTQPRPRSHPRPRQLLRPPHVPAPPPPRTRLCGPCAQTQTQTTQSTCPWSPPSAPPPPPAAAAPPSARAAAGCPSPRSTPAPAPCPVVPMTAEGTPTKEAHESNQRPACSATVARKMNIVSKPTRGYHNGLTVLQGRSTASETHQASRTGWADPLATTCPREPHCALLAVCTCAVSHTTLTSRHTQHAPVAPPVPSRRHIPPSPHAPGPLPFNRARHPPNTRRPGMAMKTYHRRILLDGPPRQEKVEVQLVRRHRLGHLPPLTPRRRLPCQRRGAARRLAEHCGRARKKEIGGWHRLGPPSASGRSAGEGRSWITGARLKSSGGREEARARSKTRTTASVRKVGAQWHC